MERKSLYDVSWKVSEAEYREDPALSYSTLAKYERSGFNGIDKLFDKVESPSLTFGSAVDSIITGGQAEFESRFYVADFQDCPDSIINIIKDCFKEFNGTYRTLQDIPDSHIIRIAALYNYQNNWKPETRSKVIKEKGADYYNLLYLSQDKEIISSDVYNKVLAAVNALKTSEATALYFQDNNPFDDSIQRFYQLKFKATFNGIDYRCMMDLAYVNHMAKLIYPCDLKTSSHFEWDFFRSFIDWNYQIQGRLYAKILKYVLSQDPYFKGFTIMPYTFIVVNKETLTPLTWVFEDTFREGTLEYGDLHKIRMRDPLEIGQELYQYLTANSKVPDGIVTHTSNSLTKWLNTL